MTMFITSKNKYLSNDMKIFGICSIPLRLIIIFFFWTLLHKLHNINYLLFNTVYSQKGDFHTN